MRARYPGLVAVVVAVLALASCGKKSNAPADLHQGLVTIRVTNQAGDSIPDELVEISHLTDEDELYLEFADSTGRARFSEILPGQYVASVTSGDSLAGAAVVTVTTTNAEWALPAVTGSVVRGHVTLTGQPDNAGVYVGFSELVTFGADTDSAGDFDIRPVPVGTWTLIAAHFALSRSAADTVTVSAPGETVYVDPITMGAQASPSLLDRARRLRQAAAIPSRSSLPRRP
jgi:hypothetical protein